MEKQIQHLQALAKKSDQLEVTEEERTNYLAQIKDFTNKYIQELPELKAYLQRWPDKEKLKITGQPQSLSSALQLFREEVNETGLRAASGGHVGYIPGGGIYTAALGDFLAAISNEYAGVAYASPGAVAIENEVLNWLKSTFHYPSTAVGNLTSGGSMANLIALTAARDAYEVKNEKIPKSVIYLSSQAHHCIQKALRIIGLGDVIVRLLPLDEKYRIIPEKLSELVEKDAEEGLLPFLVIASAGTTDVGAIDPLNEIATIAKRFNLWFHIDAAYGGFFILTSAKNRLTGIEKADSLVVDPHKGMFLPYGIGAVLVKNAQAVLASNNYSANYMQDSIDDELTESPANLSPELTKHFRGMRIWLPLQLHGIEPFVACLEEKLLLVDYFRKRLVENGFSVGPEPDLSVSYFWFACEHDENALNKKLMDLIHEDGRVFFSSTLLDGRFVIRIAILSFRTKKETMDKALEMIIECLAMAKKSLGLQ